MSNDSLKTIFLQPTSKEKRTWLFVYWVMQWQIVFLSTFLPLYPCDRIMRTTYNPEPLYRTHNMRVQRALGRLFNNFNLFVSFEWLVFWVNHRLKITSIGDAWIWDLRWKIDSRILAYYVSILSGTFQLISVILRRLKTHYSLSALDFPVFVIFLPNSQFCSSLD